MSGDPGMEALGAALSKARKCDEAIATVKRQMGRIADLEKRLREATVDCHRHDPTPGVCPECVGDEWKARTERLEAKVKAWKVEYNRYRHLHGIHLRKDNERMRTHLQAIRDYKRSEVVCDEFAYARMVRDFRDAARRGLGEEGEGKP